MKKETLLLFVLACSLLSCSKDDFSEESQKPVKNSIENQTDPVDDVANLHYTFDEKGNLIIVEEGLQFPTQEQYEAEVCGGCWKTVKRIPELPVDDDGGWVEIYYVFGKDELCRYWFVDSKPMGTRGLKKIQYSNGKLTNDKEGKELTILSINDDESITVYDDRFPHILFTLERITEEEYNLMLSYVDADVIL